LYMALAVGLYLISTLTQVENTLIGLVINTLYIIVFAIAAYFLDLRKEININKFFNYLKH